MGRPLWQRWFLVVAVALVVVVVLARCGSSPGPSAEKVATAAGATGGCTTTAFELISRLDSSHRRIYDCVIGGRLRCVTFERGIARDETEFARLLFVEQLNRDEAPSCVREGS